MDINYTEHLINELSNSACELYHKNRDVLEKIRLLEGMVSDAEQLMYTLKSELNSITS